LDCSCWAPRDRDERPILLHPDIKAVEDYRRSIWLWQAQAGELDAQITTILSGAHGSDLFARSRASQKMIDEAVHLLQDIESNKAPTAAMPAASWSEWLQLIWKLRGRRFYGQRRQPMTISPARRRWWIMPAKSWGSWRPVNG